MLVQKKYFTKLKLIKLYLKIKKRNEKRTIYIYMKER